MKSILEGYYSNPDIGTFVQAVRQRYDLPEAPASLDLSALKRYLDISQNPDDLWGPFSIWPAAVACEKEIHFLDTLSPGYKQHFAYFQKGYPLLKIGEAHFQLRTGAVPVDLWVDFSGSGKLISASRLFLTADVEEYLDRMWNVDLDGRAELMEFIGMYGSLNVEELVSIQYKLFCDLTEDVRRFLETIQDKGENEMTRSTEFITAELRKS